MIPEPLHRPALMAAAGAALIGLVLLLRIDWGAGARIAVAQAWSDPAIDAERDLGTVLAQHPAITRLDWAGDFGGDPRLVCALARIERFDALPPALGSAARGLAAMTPDWAGVALDRPLELRIVIRIDPAAGRAIGAESVRCSELWVVFHPERVADYEDALARNGAHLDLDALRLQRDGDRHLLDAGSLDPTLAGAGMALDAQAWLAAFARWDGSAAGPVSVKR